MHTDIYQHKHNHDFIHAHPHSLTHHSLIHSLTHTLTHSLTLTLTLTHSLTSQLPWTWSSLGVKESEGKNKTILTVEYSDRQHTRRILLWVIEWVREWGSEGVSAWKAGLKCCLTPLLKLTFFWHVAAFFFFFLLPYCFSTFTCTYMYMYIHIATTYRHSTVGLANLS